MQEGKRKLLAKVAYLYYIEDKNQNEIAKELNIYRTTISRMLKQARDEGIVTIEIHDYDPAVFSLELYLKEKFDLKDIVICPSSYEGTEEEKEENVAEEAASYLKRIIKKNDVVGVSWGSTLRKMIGKIQRVKMTDATFVPLAGGPSHVHSLYHVNTIVYDLARHFNGKSIFINATVVQETKELRDGIMNSKYFEEIKNYWENLDVALVGIGGPLSAKSSEWRDLLTNEDREELKLREAIGDCCCQFIDQDGKILKGNLYNRTVSVRLEQLKETPYSIGVARGKQKSRSILAMLKKQYINVLITDEETALEILKVAKDSNWRRFADKVQ
ncbi:sugar-binding transcriptional regulator [Bacillus massilinigeriensis]|uniref:sugar-binding transcriptional regulator n=1 Tax=Bacillus massilionigeriensis TaxID=1805475 RepID=UPI00096B2CDB|nr:sugar-binding transcriptional regulator [Bacillus massilionigeriensis]